MNCLECPNYWQNAVDENLCDKCGTYPNSTTTEKEEAHNAEPDLRKQ